MAEDSPARLVRDRLLARRWLVYLIVGWGVALAAAPRAGEAAPLPPRPADGGALLDAEATRLLLEHKLLRAHLVALGVSSAEAALALERLTPAERAEMAARVHELDAGGTGVDILALAIILGLLVILVLELIGRRVISRP